LDLVLHYLDLGFVKQDEDTEVGVRIFGLRRLAFSEDAINFGI
jgi:hypothetical protein